MIVTNVYVILIYFTGKLLGSKRREDQQLGPSDQLDGSCGESGLPEADTEDSDP